MAGLKTQGFSVPASPRAPAIPSNVGVVNVKEIYDGVRQGLAAYEQVRRAPASMILADEELAAGALQAPLKTRQVLAQTEGIEQQTPYRTAILAAEASPEMLEAKRQALLARGTKAPSGDIQLANSLAAAQLRLAEDPNDAQAAQLVAVLGPMALKKSAVSAANPQGVIDAGVQRTTDTNATKIQTTDATIASRESEGEKERLLRDKIASERNKATVEAAAAKRADAMAVRDQKLSVVDKKHQVALSKQLAGLETIEQATDNVETLIKEAIALTDYTTAGAAALAAFLPFKARTLKGKLSSIRANTGFDALTSLRQTSPTGGALGPVSDVENKLLQDTIAAIDQGLDPKELIINLEKIKAQRAKSLTRMQDMYERDVEFLTGGGVAPPAGTTDGAAQAASAPAAWDEQKEKELRDLEAKLAKPAQP